LIYSAGAFVFGGVLQLTPQDFERCWRTSVQGAFISSQQVLPDMVEANKGTILFTGATASLRGGSKFAALSVPKFGVRALSQSLAKEFGPKGIHVAHIIVDGQIGTPSQLENRGDRPADSFINPDAMAETYWNVYIQNPTCWTQELDIRPFSEKW
jgi:NAD(P)-dependent dehydrogenase (short-subunit alcohol dehydrogenase family)